MKQTAIEWLFEHSNTKGDEVAMEILRQAKRMERQNMLDLITIYHNNLFYIPLKDGEAERILEMILKGTITNKSNN